MSVWRFLSGRNAMSNEQGCSEPGDSVSLQAERLLRRVADPVVRRDSVGHAT